MKCILGLIAILSLSAFAEKIELPPEELASETVLPIFANKDVVKNRLVDTEGRLELGIGAGWNLTEAINKSLNYNLNLTYHFNEEHGVNFSAYFMQDGLSSYGEDLKAGKGFDSTFDASLAPAPENLMLLNYQYTAYYGKISLSKNYFMNLSLYGLAGLGMMKYSDSNNLAFNLGIGQKFYFSRNWALRFDLRTVFFKGPNPMDPNVTDPLPSNGREPLVTGGDPVSSENLEEVTFINTIISAGLVVLF